MPIPQGLSAPSGIVSPAAQFGTAWLGNYPPLRTMKDFNVIADGAAYIHRAEHLPEVGKDIDLGDGLQATVDEIRQPDLPNPVIRAWNVRPHDADRVVTAQAESVELGYTLVIVGLPRGGLESHVAGASRQGGSALMLASGQSAGEVAERGIEILRGIVKNGDPWPDVPTPSVWRASAQDS